MLLQTAPPDQNHPRIISKLITLEYESQICHQAFPPGKFFSVPALPNVTVVNALGDFAIAADRLAIIDGEGAFFSVLVDLVISLLIGVLCKLSRPVETSNTP